MSNDIYSLAYASLIDPGKFDENNPVIGEKHKIALLKQVHYNSKEMSRLFLSCLIIICIQWTMIYLIFNDMVTNPTFEI